VVFIDFTVYNANVNLFCVVKIAFEFMATGGLIPSWNFRTVKLLRYVTPFDYFIMACEFIFCFFILYYIVEEVMEIRLNGCSYFASVWNILDIVVIGISAFCIAFSVFRYIRVEGMIGDLLKNPQEFADFEFLGFWQTRYNDVVAVCIFFAWIKIFKYISFNKTMTQLSSTLSRCAKDIAGFAIMFFIVFFAFAQLGYLLFGTQVNDFRSFGDAIFTLLRTILGDFDFHAIENANRVLGPIFFISYVFFVFFVLLNMFLAIINDTYSEVKAEIAKQKNEFEIADYFKRGYNNLMGKMGKRNQLIDIQNALKLSDTNEDGCLTFAEIRNNLRKCNFSDLEIEMFFSRYDVDGDRALDEKEKRRMLADLEGRKMELDEEEEPKQAKGDRPKSGRPSTATAPVNAVSFDEFSQLQSRVNRMEHSIGSIVTKIDAMLIKLDGMEKSKDKKRETMSKMLNAITEDDQDALKLQQ
jgi:polycystin 2